MNHEERRQQALAQLVVRLAQALGIAAPATNVVALAQLIRQAQALPPAAWERSGGDGGLLHQAMADCVRRGAEALAQRRPGRSVELRVPPYVAVQLGTGDAAGPGAGPRHTRGTPPAVVETDPLTFIALLAGDLTWPTAVVDHRVTVSGQHTDLAALFGGPAAT